MMTRSARAASIAFALLVVNSAYLAAFDTPSLFYFANVAAHALLGIVLTAAAAAGVIRYRPRLSRTAAAAATALALGAAAGIGLLALGATTPHRWLLQTHIALTVAGCALLIAVLYRAARRGPDAALRPYAPLYPAAAAVLLGSAVLAHAASNRQFQQRYRIVNPTTAPLTMEGEGGGPSGPFFPSSATTASGAIIPADFFPPSAACGRCHADIYAQWNSSVHHVSSFNNQWYRKSIEYMQGVAGVRASKWCAGCHDHAV